MWIRSQDKERLIYVDNLFVNNSRILQSYKCNNIVLGKYSSNERALQILNEIETTLRMKNIKFYEMPKE